MVKSLQMKLRSTTPVTKLSFTKRVTLVTIAVIMAVAVPTSYPQVAGANQLDEYDRQIRQLQSEIDQYQSRAAELRGQADNLQAAVNALNNDIAVIQKQIDVTQAKLDKLKAEIKLNEQKIEYNQDDLGTILANLYVDDKISPLEMLASSKSIGEFVDKQEYRASARDHLVSAIDEIKKLKKELEKQKADVEHVLGDQKNAQNALAGKRAEQQSLLNQTRGDEAAYQRLSADKKARQAQVYEQYQAALRAAFSQGGGSTVLAQGVDGAYPWNSGNCPMFGYWSTGGADGNGGDGYGYGCRQCASYAAWRVARETGRYPLRWGNATNFPQSARNAGYSTGYAPRAGSLGVMHAGKAGVPEGHVVWVEAVVNGGSSVIVSQYNYDYGAGYGMYSKMEMSVGAFDEYVYIK